MTRVVTYLTSPPPDVNSHVKIGRAMVLMMDLLRQGNSLRVGDWARQQMDYALESPDWIPAGGCQQSETDCGETDAGIPEYCISGEQIALRRE